MGAEHGVREETALSKVIVEPSSDESRRADPDRLHGGFRGTQYWTISVDVDELGCRARLPASSP
jgi:hypothetical protein